MIFLFLIPALFFMTSLFGMESNEEKIQLTRNCAIPASTIDVEIEDESFENFRVEVIERKQFPNPHFKMPSKSGK